MCTRPRCSLCTVYRCLPYGGCRVGECVCVMAQARRQGELGAIHRTRFSLADSTVPHPERQPEPEPEHTPEIKPELELKPEPELAAEMERILGVGSNLSNVKTYTHTHTHTHTHTQMSSHHLCQSHLHQHEYHLSGAVLKT